MKVLLADDDAVSRRVLEITLQRLGYTAVVVEDGPAALAVLRSADAPLLAVLDWMMPGMEGIEVCRELRKDAREPYTYVILLTARGAMEDVVAGMEAGADDYLTKPFDAHELRVRLRAGQRIVELQEELIAARESLRVLAMHDALTGLLNRRAILERLDQELARARREAAPLGVVIADLDHFKRINDSYGHPAGDAVLQETAKRLVGSLRSYDALGRYGGEEFLLVLPGADRALVEQLAERVRGGVAARPILVAELELPLTLSLGAASTGPPVHLDSGRLIAAADEALYEAKQAGRNCSRVAAAP